jgi:hypothetical protein
MHEFKVISGSQKDIQNLLAVEVSKGWRPILMSSYATANSIHVFIFLELSVATSQD